MDTIYVCEDSQFKVVRNSPYVQADIYYSMIVVLLRHGREFESLIIIVDDPGPVDLYFLRGQGVCSTNRYDGVFRGISGVLGVLGLLLFNNRVITSLRKHNAVTI